MPVTSGDDTISFTANLNIASNPGNDTYLFGRTSGTMKVREGGSYVTWVASGPADPMDVVLFDADILPSEVVFTRQMGNLVITVQNSSAQLIFENFFMGSLNLQTGLPGIVVEEFRFADGTVIRGESLLPLTSSDTTGYIHGTAGNDSLRGVGDFEQVVFGKEGNDTLSGYRGGQESLYGGEGDDVYQILANPLANSEDVIGQADGTATESGFDVLEIIGDVTSSDVRLVRGYGSLGVIVGNRSNVRVNFNGYENGYSSIEAIRFANGEVLNMQEIKRRLLISTAGDDFMYGFVTDDVIDGGAGNDWLSDEVGGNDLLLGGAGRDTLTAREGADTLDGGQDNDSIRGTSANDTIVFGRNSGSDVLDSKAGVIQVAADVTASDILIKRDSSDLSIQIVGTDAKMRVSFFSFPYQSNDPFADLKIRFANGQEWDVNTIRQHIHVAPSAGDDYLVSSLSGINTLVGGLGNDSLSGAYDSTLLGGDGNDTLVGGALIDPGAGNDVVNNFAGRPEYVFGRGAGQDTLNATGASVVSVQFGADVLPEDIEVLAATGGILSGAVFRIRNTTDALTISTVTQPNSTQVTMRFANGQTWTAADVFNKALSSHFTDGDDLLSVQHKLSTDKSYGYYLKGLGGNDTLTAGGFNNTMQYPDTLDGGAGDDLLKGSYYSTAYVFGRGYGSDTIESYPSMGAVNLIKLADGIAREDVTLEKIDSDLLIRIVDTNDTLRLKNFASSWPPRSDWRIEFKSGQRLSRNDIDTLLKPVEPPPPPVTGVFVTPNNPAGGNLLGGVGNDTLLGYGGNDSLTGATGNDLLRGGTGTDTYIFNLGDGNDTIQAESEGVGTGYDNIRFGTGIGLNDVVLARSGLDLVLSYNSGADSVTIEKGLATYYSIPFNGLVPNYARPFSQLQFATGEASSYEVIMQRAAWLPMTSGDDFWYAAGYKTSANGLGGNDTLAGDAAVNVLSGDSGHDLLAGAAGNDTLNGGADNDTLQGGADQDTYMFGVGYGQDRIIEDNNGTADTIRLDTGILPTQVQLRWVGSDLVLSLAGATDTLTVQNHFSNEGDRNANANLLSLAKIESIQFANGTVWNKDTITSRVVANNAGNDFFVSQTNVSGGVGDDTLRAVYQAVTLNGGAGNDVLTGSSLNDTLQGGTGNDRLNGEAGQDVFVFGVGDGQDTVMPSTLSNDTSLDSLRLGVNAANVVFRRDSYNLYIDLAGSTDSLKFEDYFKKKGSLGQITFANSEVWNAAAVKAALPSGTAGADLFQGDLVYGNEGNDTLIGLDGVSNDTLHGGLGWDSMVGGAGDDAYTVDSTMLETGVWANDVVVELANGGYADTVTTNISGYVLPDNVENLVMTGKGEAMLSKDGTMRASGNDLGNRITGRAGADLMYGMAGQDTLQGGAGNDTLEGGEGWDSLIGGDGDDYYLVDRENSDVLIEQDRLINPNAGFDWIETHNNGYQLPDHIENLRLLAAPLGLGNSLFNILEGSDANNHFRAFVGDDTLRGLGGNDTLEGGAGNDQLEGGEGDDTYLWGRLHGADTVQDTAGANDVIQLEAGVSAEELWFQQSGNDLVMRIIGTSDQVLIKDWYTSTDNQIERVLLADGRDLQSAQVQALVDAMAGLPPPAQTTLPADASHAPIAQLIATSWA